ncbi:MAG: Lon protease [candidate division TM6 bacterium GW2011_GWF2_32_72]|nr:MAG: Lon protease [candidate division TM6 bacterium GW2011_GWF2_32_72]
MKALSSKKITKKPIKSVFPVIPTMDVVVFPNMIVPLLVMDERIIKGVDRALEGDKLVYLLAARTRPENTEGAIGTQDLFSVGTVASVMRVVQVPEGGIKILVQGIYKARTNELVADSEVLSADVEKVEFDTDNQSAEIIARVNGIKEIAEKMVSSGQSLSPDFHVVISRITDPNKLADFILSHLNLDVKEAQDLLEAESLVEFLTGIYAQLNKELQIAEVQDKIKNHARESMNESQKEYYLREQLRAIKKELGDEDFEDMEKLHKKLLELKASDEVKSEVKRQISRLEKTASDSMEATVIRNYLDWVLNLPWGVETEDNLDIKHAKEVLDEDHYGLKSVKDRILDYISVRNLKQGGNTPIICLVGPPGVGKTSLGASIARSLGRKYFRVALGGVKDEAEIRGHRRTYVGAMPGRFIQGIKKAGSCNPVVIIDELDKIGSDFRGDPSAAMLEILDPKQNNTFYDNYLGVPFDLSKAIFIATANSLETISGPLRDRMEVISLSGYTMEEKIEIAKRHIVHRAMIDTGLEGKEVKLGDDVIGDLVSSYTRESGVRQLDRTIRKLCSKVARSLVEEGKMIDFTPSNLDKYLGPRIFAEEECSKVCQVGITNGLAWTSFGGEMIKIEAVSIPGKGRLILTGQLGDVMKESAQAALSYARVHAKEFGLDDKMFTNYDLHIHVPAGAVPKDGPSAGVTMLSSILSALTDRPIDADYAMTGEINLRGEVMPIGGVREKILAAKRNKISHILLPMKNKNDLVGMDEDITKGIDVIWVDKADQILNRVLMEKVGKIAR